MERLAGSDGAGLDEAALVEVISALESLKGAAAAAQARHSVALEAAQAAGQARLAPGERVGTSVGHQVALARRESPYRGSRHLGLAKALVAEMPHTHAALSRGQITEWGATLVVQATACLSREDRARVDAELAPRLGSLSQARLAAAARSAAYRLDPSAFVSRGRRAAKDRRVSTRPAPDVMSIVSAFVPAAQGVACYRALDEHAKALRSAGDERSLDQIKADTFVERITGQTRAADVPIEVGLVITDTTLFTGHPGPARLTGYGPIPAQYARDLLTPPTHEHPTSSSGSGSGSGNGGGGEELATRARVWLRRLYTDPVTGSLADQDPRRRLFTGALRRYLVARDQTCRTPYCDAPIRHLDHAVPHTVGGPTSDSNGQGLCRACNHAKETPGWHHHTLSSTPSTGAPPPAPLEDQLARLLGIPPPGTPGSRQHTRVTTPTGHHHDSRPPPVLDHLPPTGPPRRHIARIYHPPRRIYVDFDLSA
ncbi:HNH endonuclease [Ornithinicoccus halotolerans]|uniref:HNH endonuclease n=1 Tax=Ornithinicoccus halotolerans TaxID=1748220 RepID=UPI001886301A|nr:DUF222 domain-containing protein [Ornithinicoccus halotolerans]